MANVLLSFHHGPRPCSYLPGREATLEYRIMTDVSPEEYEALVVRGWRRFAHEYFQPVCGACTECVSLRVPVAEFVPSGSQCRALKKCAGLRVEIRRPVAEPSHFALWRRWHSERERSRGWEDSGMDFQSFAASFCEPHPCAWEFDYFDGPRLVAVGFVDETPNAVSSVYFFWEPECAGLSLGVASALFEIAWARERGRAFLYPGYRVAGCPSTAYKSQYRPHDFLIGRPRLEEEPVWSRAAG